MDEDLARKVGKTSGQVIAGIAGMRRDYRKGVDDVISKLDVIIAEGILHSESTNNFEILNHETKPQ